MNSIFREVKTETRNAARLTSLLTMSKSVCFPIGLELKYALTARKKQVLSRAYTIFSKTWVDQQEYFSRHSCVEGDIILLWSSLPK